MHESKVVTHVSLIRDIPVINSTIDQLLDHSQLLYAGALPVGTVEFVKEAMQVVGIEHPEAASYHPTICGFLNRNIVDSQLGYVLDHNKPMFVKPMATKQFTGFVWRGADFDYDETQEDPTGRLKALTLPRNTPVWVSHPLEFLCEWRYYVLNGRVIGSARYDPDGLDSAPSPDEKVVFDAAASMSTVFDGFSLDVGVVKSGETLVVEANDGWALGYYNEADCAVQYVELLQARWNQMIKGEPSRLSLIA